MKHRTCFHHQHDLEDFLHALQQCFAQCAVLISNQVDQEVVYYFQSEHFSQQLLPVLQDQQQAAIKTGKLRHGTDEFFYHQHPIYVDDQNFSGYFSFLYPTQVSQPRPQKQVDTDLSATFYSQSMQMQQMFSIIERVAITEFPVLVRGESGSGKELVAQAIHAHSQRRDQVFIAINCAALNTNLLESELFGHVKGAFTGAIRGHKGVFERAAGGTLFLDEIAEIPLELQAKLLRVLETGEFTPLGGEQSIKANVRIITATHRALREEARLGRFRQDLLYRLRVIPIFVPPLRQRKEDIPSIAQAILTEQAKVLNQPIQLCDNALQILTAYDWPGNVRELKNTLLYAMTMANGKAYIEVGDLPNEITESASLSYTPATSSVQPIPEENKLTKARLHALLCQYPDDLNQVAAQLNISRTTLWRYRKKFKL